ncbi:MAG: hypothetical protein HS111_21635 [Kofleriaceae bacterium]|nr:hypothetical protein [Kofleriaceae bacterium]
MKLERPDDELRLAYQVVVERSPRSRLALFHLESLVRRAGSSADPALLEDAIAAYFLDDPRTRAALLTRGGETLTGPRPHRRGARALPGRRRAARAEVTCPRSRAGARRRCAASSGRFAEAASREAAQASDPSVRARLHHLAGVALMDRALAGERARRRAAAALDADPRHGDAFTSGSGSCSTSRASTSAWPSCSSSASLVEEDRGGRSRSGAPSPRWRATCSRIAMAARRHYCGRLVEAVPGDRAPSRARPTSPGSRGRGASAPVLTQRAERERAEGPASCARHLVRRLGVIHAERLPDPAAAFARPASGCWPAGFDDEAALERLADLGIADAQQWKLALGGACERLVKHERDPQRKVAHRHRVGRIFAEGFADRRRAERARPARGRRRPRSDVALRRAASGSTRTPATSRVDPRPPRRLVAARTMRNRLGAGAEPSALRVIARVARARHDAEGAAAGAVARAAAATAPACSARSRRDAPVAPPPDLSAFARSEVDEVLVAADGERRAAPAPHALLGDRLAAHVGIDLRPYG